MQHQNARNTQRREQKLPSFTNVSSNVTNFSASVRYFQAARCATADPCMAAGLGNLLGIASCGIQIKTTFSEG